MQIWYLSPFLLAMLVWLVATRKHPEDKEKWTWMALGVCCGSILMFVVAYIGQSKSIANSGIAGDTVIPGPANLSLKLPSDAATEVLPPTRIRQNRSISIGSLQITLLKASKQTVNLQIEPHEAVEIFGARVWTRTSGSDSNYTSITRVSAEVPLGQYISVGFHGRLYRVGLLEIQLPLRGIGLEVTQELWDSYAVVRLLDVGEYWACRGQDPSDTTFIRLNPGRGGGGGEIGGNDGVSGIGRPWDEC